MSRLVQLNNALARCAGLTAAFAVVAMMLLVAMDAFVRQVFNVRIPFVSVTVANYFMVMIAFLPLAQAETHDRHISVDLVFGNLNPGMKRVVAVGVYALCAITCAGLTWTMWDEAVRRYASASVAVEDGVSMAIWPGYFMLPAGFFLLSVTYLLRVVLGIAGAANAYRPLDEDDTALKSETIQ